MGGSSESSEHSATPERDNSAMPELEPRRSAPTPVPKEAVREEEFQRRVAIYLIEREAIELRRQRWVDLSHGLVRTATSADAQPPMAGAAPLPPDYDAEDRARLAKYDRPKPGPDAPPPSRIRRVGSWLKSLFLGD